MEYRFLLSENSLLNMFSEMNYIWVTSDTCIYNPTPFQKYIHFIFKYMRNIYKGKLWYYIIWHYTTKEVLIILKIQNHTDDILRS